MPKNILNDAESTQADEQALSESGNSSTELSKICEFLSEAQLSALEKFDARVPADLLKLTLNDLISAAIVTGPQYEAMINVLCRQNLDANEVAMELVKKFQNIKNEGNLFHKAKELDRKIQLLKNSNLPDHVRVEDCVRILGEICYWENIAKAAKENTIELKELTTLTTTTITTTIATTTTTSCAIKNNINRVNDPTKRIVSKTAYKLSKIDSMQPKTKQLQVVLFNNTLSKYNLQKLPNITLSPTLTPMLPVYTVAQIKPTNLQQEQQQQQQQDSQDSQQQIEAVNENVADADIEKVEKTKNLVEQISKFKLAKTPKKRRKVVVEIVQTGTTKEQPVAINSCEKMLPSTDDSTDQMANETSINEQTQQSDAVQLDASLSSTNCAQNDNKAEATAVESIQSFQKTPKSVESKKVSNSKNINNIGKSENILSALEDVNLPPPSTFSLRTGPTQPFKMVTRLRAKTLTHIEERTDLRVKLTRKRKIEEVKNVETKVEEPASPVSDDVVESSMTVQRSYNLYEIDLPLPQLKAPNSLKALLNSSIADPRLRKYRLQCESPETPVNIMPRNIQSPPQTYRGESQPITPAFQFSNSNFQAELKQKINMDLYTIQQRSEWYQDLPPARKLDITQHLSELGSVVLAFQQEKRFHPQAVFNIFNMDNAIMLIEIMRCLNMNVSNQGIIFQTMPRISPWSFPTHIRPPPLPIQSAPPIMPNVQENAINSQPPEENWD